MKRIVIMGATSGIGLHLAEALAATGWMVGIAGRKQLKLEELTTRYPTFIKAEEIDVTKDNAPQKLLSLINKLGGMDVYFHSAGIGYENPMLNSKEEIATVETNAVGFVRMVDTAFNYFRDRKIRGQIAVISSVAGTKGIGDLASYSATKKFQQTYIQALEQLSHKQKLGLSFTDIRPGWIRTPLLDSSREYPMTMRITEAVPLVIKAVKNKTRIAVIDWRWAVAVFFWQLIPGCLWVRIPMNVSKKANHSQMIQNIVAETN